MCDFILFQFIQFSMQSVIIDFGTNQHNFLTIDVEKLSFNWFCKCFFFLYWSYITTSLTGLQAGSSKFIFILVSIFFLIEIFLILSNSERASTDAN